nr:hypothetical protein [Tanacetum cinerariifolium]
MFQANDCDAFDLDVDEAPTEQTMFMANLSSADHVTDEAGPLYDLDILSEVQDHNQYMDDVFAHHEEHVMHGSVQLDHVVDSHGDYTSDSNMIPYDQYVKNNEGKDNVIRQLKKQLSQLQVTRSETGRTPKVQTTDSQNTKLTGRVTHLQAQNDMFRAKNDKIKQHYKELNNRDAYLDYLRHLKECVKTIRDIVEEAKVLAHIPLTSKKQVTVSKPSDKSDSSTHRHVMTVKSPKTNVPVPPSIGVNSFPNASGSQPKSHVKPHRISPAKGVNKLPVEDHPRTNKSHLRTSNRVNSSSRLKRT